MGYKVRATNHFSKTSSEQLNFERKSVDLVCHSCYNKTPQTGWLKQQKSLFLESWRLRSAFWECWSHLRSFPLACHGCLPASSHLCVSLCPNLQSYWSRACPEDLILPSFPLSNTIRYSFVWFLSVSIIILRFVFATSLINISFFPLAEKYSIVGVIRNSLTPCWVTFWFPILGYCKKPMSIFFYMSLYGYTLPFVRLMPPSRMLGVECLHVWLLKNTQTVFQRGTILHC